MALIELAKMNAAVSATARADEWQTKAEALKAQTTPCSGRPTRVLPNPRPFTPLEHPFDESSMVAFLMPGVYSGLTDFQQTAIFDNLEQARIKLERKSRGFPLSLLPNQWPNLF